MAEKKTPTKEGTAKLVVPKHLKGKTVWTAPPTFGRQAEKKGRFELDKCNQKELAYLKKQGIPLEEG